MANDKTGLSPRWLRELARAAVEATLKEIQAEIIAIERTFPELALARRRRQVRKAIARATTRTDRFSAAAQRAISQRMKR
jgi:hypothetical protein